MANVDRDAAEIVAYHERVHRWPSGEPGFNEGLVRFLEVWTPHAEGQKLYVRIPPGDPWRRSIHLYAESDGKRTVTTLEVNDTYRRTTTPNVEASLRRSAHSGDRGQLADEKLWVDPRIQGVFRSFIWWGNESFWCRCSSAGRRASRLAYEVLSGSPWESKFREGVPAVRMDPERRARIVRDAADLQQRLERWPHAIPLRVRGAATMTQAIAYYLVKDSEGPRMSWRDAARHTGTREWRTLYAAVRDRAEKVGDSVE